MSKKIDYDKIVRDSFSKAQKDLGLLKEVAPQQAQEPEGFDLFDQLPFLKIKETTFTEHKPSSQDEATFRKIFDTFADPDIKIAINKLNTALGINVSEELEDQFVSSGQNLNSKNFSALSIMNVMYYTSLLEPKAGGLLYEPLVAALLSGRSIGVEGGATDIAVDGSKNDVLEYSLKLLGAGGDFKLSIKGVIDKARSLFKKNPNNLIKLLVVLKPERGEKRFYCFYQISITEESIVKVIYKKDIPTKEVLEDYFSIILEKAKTDKSYKDKPQFQALVQKIQNHINASSESVFKEIDKLILDLDKPENESLKDSYELLNRIAGGVKIDEAKILKEEDDEEIKVSKKDVKGAKYRGTDNPVSWRQSLEKNKIPVEWKGSILISKEAYAQNIQQNNKSIIESFKQLLVPLNTALKATNEYFLDEDPIDKIGALKTAAKNADLFIVNAGEAFKEEQKKTTNIPVQENKDNLNNLTKEAKIVMEMLKRLEE